MKTDEEAAYATLCELVSTNAEWAQQHAEYATVLLSPEAAEFFAARLPGAGAAPEVNSNLPSKEPTPHADKTTPESGVNTANAVVTTTENDVDTAVVVCEHCGGTVPECEIRVACFDGTTLVLSVPQLGLVHEVKRRIGQVRHNFCRSIVSLVYRVPRCMHRRISHNIPVCLPVCLQSLDMDPGLFELFIHGTENKLPDAKRLGSGALLFMLQRQGWCWTTCGGDMVLSGKGLVASRHIPRGGNRTVVVDNWLVATGGVPMTEGRHYWEVQIGWTGRASGVQCPVMVGAVRPGLDLASGRNDAAGQYYIFAGHGSLFGSGKSDFRSGQFTTDSDAHGGFAAGDRVGVLLDLDAGWMRFYHNGEQCGPAFAEGVTGPLVRAAKLGHGSGGTPTVTVTALPGAAAPEALDE